MLDHINKSSILTKPFSINLKKIIKTLCIHRIDLRHTKQKPRILEQKQHWNTIISEDRSKELLKND